MNAGRHFYVNSKNNSFCFFFFGLEFSLCCLAWIFLWWTHLADAGLLAPGGLISGDGVFDVSDLCLDIGSFSDQRDNFYIWSRFERNLYDGSKCVQKPRTLKNTKWNSDNLRCYHKGFGKCSLTEPEMNFKYADMSILLFYVILKSSNSN